MNDAVNTIRSSVRQVTDWWVGELVGIVPDKWRQLLAGPRPARVELSEHRLRVFHPSSANESIVGELELPADPADLRALLRKTGTPGHATLLLAGVRSVRRRVELPAAAEENLGEVLAFDLDRLTPFRRKDVYLAWRIAGRDRASRRLTVELEVAPRRAVDQAVDTLKQLGVVADRVELAPDRDQPVPLNLLPPRPVSAPARWHARLNFALAVVVVLLAGVLVAGNFQHERALANALKTQIETEREQADAVLRLEEKVEQLRTSRGYVSLRRAERPLSAELLDEAARLLPDHTYLLEAHLRDNRLELLGYSAAVSELVDAFSSSPLFADVSFLAPVTRDAREKLDRFSLGLAIAPRRHGEARVEASGRQS